MNAAARRARRNLMINFSYRFTEASFALKGQVDAGAVGEIYFGRSVWHRRRGIPGLGGWFTDRERSGGGPLIDLGVHRLDLALWLMGYPEPVAVTGSTYSVIAPEVARKAGESYTVEDLACRPGEVRQRRHPDPGGELGPEPAEAGAPGDLPLRRPGRAGPPLRRLGPARGRDLHRRGRRHVHQAPSTTAPSRRPPRTTSSSTASSSGGNRWPRASRG